MQVSHLAIYFWQRDKHKTTEKTPTHYTFDAGKCRRGELSNNQWDSQEVSAKGRPRNMPLETSRKCLCGPGKPFQTQIPWGSDGFVCCCPRTSIVRTRRSIRSSSTGIRRGTSRKTFQTAVRNILEEEQEDMPAWELRI
jgi:hypothetical protein